MVDNFSRFVFLGALKDRSSGSTTKWIMEHVIGICGSSIIIKSDNGSEFKKIFAKTCKNLDI